MPSTGRHAARGSFRRANSRAEGQLYPVVPPVELEMENLEEQRELIQKWRPIFDRFDHDHDGEIPLGELRTILASAAADSSIPTTCINEIVRRADYDQNGVLDFHEFMNMVKTHELALLYPKLNKMFRAAAFIAVPRNERLDVVQSGLEEYKCCPPPFVMPLLSLIEVSSSITQLRWGKLVQTDLFHSTLH